MYCKKCGTEQHEGQKFCPKCGEPFLDENGQPYLKGVKKDLHDIKDKIISKVEELKSFNWEERKEKATSYINEFLNNPSKVKLFTKAIVCLFVLWFFIKMGSSAPLIWYIVIGALVTSVFTGIPKIKTDVLKSQYISLAIYVVIMYIITANISEGGGGISGIFHKKTAREEFIESLDDPATAYVVCIYRKVISGPGQMGWVEVPENEPAEGYEWTLIFFPENESKTIGRATMELRQIDRNYALARGRGGRYKYEIRDDIVECYEGRNEYTGNTLRDVRFSIVKEDGVIQLKGHYDKNERLFKRTVYRYAHEKEKH